MEAEAYERLWDASEVADYLGVSRSWVYERANAGDLPVLRVGGLLRFEPAAIRAYARGERAAEASVALLKRPKWD